MAYTVIIPDEPEQIQAGLIKCAGEKGIHLMLTADGTGVSSRDVIPESTLTVVELEACGLSEAMRVEKGLLVPCHRRYSRKHIDRQSPRQRKGRPQRR